MSKGKPSAKELSLLTQRTIFVVSLPFFPAILTWVVLRRLGEEMWSACKLAYWDCCGEIASLRRLWRGDWVRP